MILIRLSYKSPVSSGAMCSCCDEAKTERGVLTAIDRGDAMIYRFVCGECIVANVETYATAAIDASPMPETPSELHAAMKQIAAAFLEEKGKVPR